MTEQAKKLNPLSRKHQKFVNEYLLCFNGTDAYTKTYPKSSRDSARTTASELLAKPNIQAEIKSRLAEVHMSADEALKLRADIARGDITDLLTSLGTVDISLIKEKGLGRLIKKIKQRTITKIGKGDKDDDTEIHEIEIETYPADSAQQDILKIHEKLKDTPNQPITIVIKKASD